jgi:hypothetical protein
MLTSQNLERKIEIPTGQQCFRLEFCRFREEFDGIFWKRSWERAKSEEDIL